MSGVETDSSDSDQNTKRRQRFVSGLMIIIWGILVGRLVQIQVASGNQFTAQATRQQIDEVTISARPGDILDRRGRLLATTLKVPSLFIDPSRVEDPATLIRELGELIEIDVDRVSRQLSAYRSKKFLWIKRQLSEEEVLTLQESELDWNVFGLRDEFKRFYPQQTLARHVLGIRDIDGKGRGGVEQFFDKELKGRSGVRRYVRDARGQMLEMLEEVTIAPEMGTSIVLTLDSVIQLFTEQALDELVERVQPFGASTIVLDPRSGEILAMASRPNLVLDSEDEMPPNAWTNHAIASAYEPGSTFKPLVAAWALERNAIEFNESFQCEWGAYRMGTRVLRDHHSYGVLGLDEILIKSSNIGMAKIGERLGNAELHQLAIKLGFGRRTGIELPGEAGGIVRPLDRWDDYSTGSIPMGHELSVTPIQMIAAHAMLANRGQRVSPHLVRDYVVETSSPQQVLVSEMIRPEIASWIVESALVGVIEEGTGHRARISGLSVFGKTGTAQKYNPEGGYFDDRHVSSFICGAPADNPRVLVLVCVDEPTSETQSGGTVAAPYASKILESTIRQLDLYASQDRR
ncbi:Peptidoglycan D,D-transpeptidase FtsI [Thalassoglobus neptunius]|uniref:Peptidoglycan D,D-transpeptidase FtsI n=1 Tax=Thalassoglobus neptunius TaxID=1938619 RepID=A0A5C5X447_9PLAN|nr:penicillin-binding protein 2 [Thalassoglobus neptunius]TWT57744.1 Peptidoglycan D,D-transpeptidase FtsI [Thalassoglobus neptunius]